MSRKLLNAATLLSTVLFVSHVQAADGIVRHKIPNSDFPISLAVEIPASVTVVNLREGLKKTS
ncbi:hypothetical protein EGJ42_14485 [Stutzerimonas stutzeri]|nr:hypothetical protein EGJ42_14485 [Stutzerimonas stutzeri]